MSPADLIHFYLLGSCHFHRHDANFFLLFVYKQWKDNLPKASQMCIWLLRQQNSCGQHGVHLGPIGPRWTPCWPHGPCYQSKAAQIMNTLSMISFRMSIHLAIGVGRNSNPNATDMIPSRVRCPQWARDGHVVEEMLTWDAPGCQKLLLVAGGIRCGSVDGTRRGCKQNNWHRVIWMMYDR